MAMAPSLRKRLSKRAPLDALSQKSDTAPLPLLAALEHLPKSKEDLNSTPPPPKHLVSPQNSQKARRSPSKSLLDRYKVRAPNMKAAKSPTPGDQSTIPPAKTTSFKEDLRKDDERPLLNEDTQAKAAADPPVKSTILTVDGVDFQMVRSSQSPAAARRSRSTDPPTTKAADPQPLRRSTRSQTRREQRADSAVSDNEINNSALPKSKNTTAQESSNSQDNAPRLRSILKKKDPSPTTTPPPAAAITEAPSRPKIPRTIRPVSLSPKQTPPPTDPTPPTNDDSDSSSSASSDSNSSTHALLSPTAQKSTTLKPKPRIRASIPPTNVLPPSPDAQLLPGLIWASPLSATSRPAKPWTWCKRWTCCRCEGDTIVEQGVCARLACGHLRCGTRCRVGEREGRGFRF